MGSLSFWGDAQGQNILWGSKKFVTYALPFCPFFSIVPWYSHNLFQNLLRTVFTIFNPVFQFVERASKPNRLALGLESACLQTPTDAGMFHFQVLWFRSEDDLRPLWWYQVFDGVRFLEHKQLNNWTVPSIFLPLADNVAKTCQFAKNKRCVAETEKRSAGNCKVYCRKLKSLPVQTPNFFGIKWPPVLWGLPRYCSRRPSCYQKSYIVVLFLGSASTVKYAARTPLGKPATFFLK